MSKTLAATLGLSLRADFINAADLATTRVPLVNNSSFVFTHGEGAGQAEALFADTRTLTASATEDVDLSGGLADAFGASIAFTKIKALIVKASPGNTNDVVVGGNATSPCAAFFGADTDTLRVKPGGMVCLVAPGAAGYAVVAGTDDLLTFTNGGGVSAVSYDLIVIGAVA